MKKSDKTFRLILAIIAALSFVWSSGILDAQAVSYKVKGKVVEGVARKQRATPHDSITQWHYRQGTKVVPVYVGRRGGLYYWMNGKKHYLPKAVKMQLQSNGK